MKIGKIFTNHNRKVLIINCFKKENSLLSSLKDVHMHVRSKAKRHRATSKSVHDSFRSILDMSLFDLLPGNLDEKICWLISQYSFTVIAKMCRLKVSTFSSDTTTEKTTQEQLLELSPETIKKVLSFITSMKSSEAVHGYCSKALPSDYRKKKWYCANCNMIPYNQKYWRSI